MTSVPSVLPAEPMISLNESATDSQIWDSLKKTITNTSGFQRWQLEQDPKHRTEEFSLDHQVSLYLRETLETLAY